MKPKEFYDNFFQRRGFRRPGILNRRIQQYAIDSFREGWKILDIGCGDGWFGQQCINAGYEYIGIDWSTEGIRLAREHVGGGEFYVIDLEADQSIIGQLDYDIITFLQFLEHINSDVECVESIPSGRMVFISVPDKMSKGHVRIFKSAESVYERYGEFVEFESVKQFKRRRWCDWVGMGVRK